MYEHVNIVVPASDRQDKATYTRALLPKPAYDNDEPRPYPPPPPRTPLPIAHTYPPHDYGVLVLVGIRRREN